ncbi:MAG: PhzF family phenazine biosynthesis protein, partial [Jatrophihabitantaceae bacterium]
DRLGQDRVRIWTRSGRVEARVFDGAEGGRRVEISQPVGTVEPLHNVEDRTAEILSVLGITAGELALRPISNARTSRVKTLVPLLDPAVLDGLDPDFARVESLCERLGSTGLYPYAVSDLDVQVFDARQFPKSSGYPEDAATGIAATALAFGLLDVGLVEPTNRPILVRQGRAMGRPSQLSIRFELTGSAIRGCWLSGAVEHVLGPGGDT